MRKIKLLLLAIASLAPNSVDAGDMNCFGMDAQACETFSLTNVERLKANLAPLSYSPVCNAMAQEQSVDMATYGYFHHSRPAVGSRPPESFSQRAVRFGLMRGVGENIAKTNSAARAMQMWMYSEGHRKNILNPRFTTLGVGHSNGLYTQVFGR